MNKKHEGFSVVGLPTRTNNREATDTIPPHWDTFMKSDIAARLGLDQPGDIFAVYTEHENAGQNNLGEYTFIIGYQVSDNFTVPEGLVVVNIPPSLREVIVLEPGRSDLVASAWQDIWNRNDIDMTYLSDFERYGTDGSIEISLGVRQ